MNPIQSLIHLVTDPNIAFILFTVGLYGLVFELHNPNLLTGILGALAVILALVGFGSLPLNLAGLLLVGLGVILIAVEPMVPSHGLLTVGGVISFILGASALYTAPGKSVGPVVVVATPLIAVMAATTAAFGGLIVWGALRSRRVGPGHRAGTVTLGATGIIGADLAPVGSVYLAKEHWSARTADGASIRRGARVRVVAIEGLTLIVEPDPSSSTAA